MSKHRSRRKHRDSERPVFTFRQMERVVDLIDRQARLIAGERFLPVDAYVYAKNDYFEHTYFIYDPAYDAYNFTLHAREPAIVNYNTYGIDTYIDGVVGIYRNPNGAVRYRFYLGYYYHAKYNPTDVTITFYTIPKSTILDMKDLGYIQVDPDNENNYLAPYPVDYHRDYVPGEG